MTTLRAMSPRVILGVLCAAPIVLYGNGEMAVFMRAEGVAEWLVRYDERFARMKYDQAIKLALELIDAECKRLAPLANMAEPPAGLPAMPTPGALRAAEQRRKLNEARAILGQRIMFEEVA